MRNGFLGLAVSLALVMTAPARAADKFEIDPVHTSVSFKIPHVGISWIHGRFNEYSGSFTIDKANPSASSFALAIKIESIDTNNKKRDGHLRSPDFFNAKQFPTMSFKSTSVKAVNGGYEVTGNLTLHGVTKPITFTLKGGKEVEFPKGTRRIGFSTDLQLKRSAFGMDKFVPAAGDEVDITISLEGVKQ
jgi:polyisoprenoid-binding protein YceI